MVHEDLSSVVSGPVLGHVNSWANDEVVSGKQPRKQLHRLISLKCFVVTGEEGRPVAQIHSLARAKLEGSTGTQGKARHRETAFKSFLSANSMKEPSLQLVAVAQED